MKTYVIYRTDVVGYDEYDSHVVIADNKKEAMELLEEEYKDYFDPWGGSVNEKDIVISLVRDKGVVLSSFNAG